MSTPTYVGIKGARKILEDNGFKYSLRQIQRAAHPDPDGRRKLPFFKDPITQKLTIEVQTLLDIYMSQKICAANKARYGDSITLEKSNAAD